VADTWRKRGSSRGSLLTGGRCPATAPRNQWERATCAVRAIPAEQRGRGEADGWAAVTVPGGGEAAACVERPWARVGRPRKEKVGQAQMNSRISDLFKSVLNKFKLI
jgi:hypothetical protein